MKIENEITGHVKIHTSSRLQIELWIKDEQVDFFALDLEAETVEIHVEKSTGVLLGMRRVYEDYIKLIADLGLEIPSKWKKHWKPTLKEATIWYYFVDSKGKVERNSFSSDTFDNELIANFNAFPTRELAELGCNVSKISRLALLWQYANDCVHTPDWSSNTKNNFHFSLNIKNDKIDVDRVYLFKRDIYFKTRKQAEAFVEMYKKEIKDTMEI